MASCASSLDDGLLFEDKINGITVYTKSLRGWFPLLVCIRQHGQTGDRPVISVENPVVVDKHTFGKLSLLCTLYFNVNVYPLLVTIQHIDPDELVIPPAVLAKTVTVLRIFVGDERSCLNQVRCVALP